MPTALSQLIRTQKAERLSPSLPLAAHPRLEQDVDVSGVCRTASASVLCHKDNDVATEAGEVKAMRPDLEEREPDSFMPINHARWAGERWPFQTIFSATHDLEERRKGWLLFMPVSKSLSINSWRSNPPFPSLFLWSCFARAHSKFHSVMRLLSSAYSLLSAMFHFIKSSHSLNLEVGPA